VIGPSVTKAGRAYWLCRCQCGTERGVFSAYLRNGLSGSCGCLHREIVAATMAAVSLRHGFTRYPEYRTYCAMLGRCDNPKDSHYYLYGARGITVCERWRETFKHFYVDMGPKPTPAHSIERKNTNADYTPDNCEWATIDVQANNTRRNVKITALGETRTIAQWAKHSGIDHETIRYRIRRGWSPDDAVTKPARIMGRAKRPSCEECGARLQPDARYLDTRFVSYCVPCMEQLVKATPNGR
jgi:hypothetical protein